MESVDSPLAKSHGEVVNHLLRMVQTEQDSHVHRSLLEPKYELDEAACSTYPATAKPRSQPCSSQSCPVPAPRFLTQSSAGPVLVPSLGSTSPSQCTAKSLLFSRPASPLSSALLHTLCLKPLLNHHAEAQVARESKPPAPAGPAAAGCSWSHPPGF